MSWWHVAAGANAAIFISYLTIATVVFSGLVRSGHARKNPLAVATAVIFFSCGVGHGLHLVHLLLPSLGAGGISGQAARVLFHWHMAAWNVVTAGVGIWYLTLRGRIPALIRGAAMFEDLAQRHGRALEIHDGVVQNLVEAKLALELGRGPQGLAALERGLASSRDMVTDLLGDGRGGADVAPGDLRRMSAAGSAG